MRRISGISFGVLGQADRSIRISIDDNKLSKLVGALVRWYYGISMDGEETGIILSFVNELVRPRFTSVTGCPVIIKIDHQTHAVVICFDQRSRATGDLNSGMSMDPAFFISSACVGVKLYMDKIVREVYHDGVTSLPDVRAFLGLEDGARVVDPDQCLKVKLEDGRIGFILLDDLFGAIYHGTDVEVSRVGPSMGKSNVLDQSMFIPARPLWEEFREVVSARVLQNWTFGQQSDD